MALQDAPPILENEGFELVGYHDLDHRPGFKLALREHEGRWYLYTGRLWESGWAVLDVTSPSAPEFVTSLDGPPGTWTIQVQAADGLLVTGLEKPMPGWGVPEGEPFEEGAIFWDISTDPAHPRQLGSWHTGATGTHRNFYAGGRYAFMTATRPDWVGHGLVILDIADPAHPVEVGTWAWAEQLNDHGQGVQQAYLHGPAHVEGNRAYLPHGRVGLVILDISDLAAPRLISRLSFGDLGSVLGAHSAVPLSGRNLLVVNGEAIEESDGDALNYTYVVDISDETRPRIISTMPMPTPSAGLPYANYYAKGGRFGPHNQHHFQGNPAHLDLSRHVVMTYFNAGLRLYDVADPLQPREIGHFVPADPTERRGALPHTLVAQFEDVIVDARGYIYCTDKNYGLFVLRSIEPLS
ncbi:MAG: hypothetical protein QOF36_1380 [Microbacteriaceae bacterium]|jgi:hypothetical protein|nr:hypothetical protein [Microbacteriaceae bacterium]